MIFEEVPLENIDLGNEGFRISEDLDSARLEESLRRAGQLSPVQLFESESSRLLVVCGFRRLRALQRLKARAVFARVWHSSECSELRAFEMALWDNLSHRELTALEIARALFALKNLFEGPNDLLVREYLPIFGLPPHKNVLRSYLTLHTLHPMLRKMFQKGRITLASAERLSRTDLDFQDKMARVLEQARWTASMQREVLDLLEELSAIWKCSPAGIFDRSEISSVLSCSDRSPAQKGERIREILHRWRNPRVSVAEEQFMLERIKLGLPAQVQLSPDPFFESNRVRVEFAVSSAEGFRKMAAALQSASQNSALDELFRVV